MSIIGSNILAGASSAVSAYDIDNSVRLDDVSNLPYAIDYLSREISSTSTSSNFTFSCWFKIAYNTFSTDSGSVAPYYTIYSSGNSDAWSGIGLSDQSVSGGLPCIMLSQRDSGGGTHFKQFSNNVIRDPSAWLGRL